jgi:hypothetical protein
MKTKAKTLEELCAEELKEYKRWRESSSTAEELKEYHDSSLADLGKLEKLCAEDPSQAAKIIIRLQNRKVKAIEKDMSEIAEIISKLRGYHDYLTMMALQSAIILPKVD